MQCKSINGILLLDKPVGITSNGALQKAKRLLQASKVGHTGSLDPLASGMLPLCFGEAAKFSRFFLEADKCYQTVMRLGITTTTGDCEGELIAEKPVPVITPQEVMKMLEHFQGSKQQIPPMFSALKHQGQPLYKLARQGKTIPRQPRNITIHRLVLDKIEENDGVFISLTVICSKGTYIRTLVEDMGAHLGCGGHVVALRRLWGAPFQNMDMIDLPTLEGSSLSIRRGQLLSIQEVLALVLPVVKLSAAEAGFIRRGQSVPVASLLSGWVTLEARCGEFLGVGEMLEDGRVAPRRLVHQPPTVVENTSHQLP